MLLKFLSIAREIPKNRWKFTKNAIFDLFWITSLKKVYVCKNRAKNVKAARNNTTFTFFEKKTNLAFFSCLTLITSDVLQVVSFAVLIRLKRIIIWLNRLKKKTSCNHLSRSLDIKSSTTIKNLNVNVTL